MGIFETEASLAAAYLPEGILVRTLGSITANDGLGATYYVQASGTGITLANGKVAAVFTEKDLSSVLDKTYDIESAETLRWKNYGNSHTIFDASQSTAPDGTAIDNTNPGSPWIGTYPNIMGWNGTSTYGVRVASSQHSDGAISSSGSNANGYYVKYGNGLIHQWGTLAIASGQVLTHNFPIAYVTQASIIGTTSGVRSSSGGSGTDSIHCEVLNTSQINFTHDWVSGSYVRALYFHVIGY